MCMDARMSRSTGMYESDLATKNLIIDRGLILDRAFLTR